MFFVEARYQTSPRKAGEQVRYIAHREEGLEGGERRTLYGIGPRYKAFRGEERAIRRALVEDGRGLRRPVYFRFILTVDTPTARRFGKLDGLLVERAIRDAVEATFRGAARGVQGAFAVHQHGGMHRPAHPHVHALLSPRLENRSPIHLSPKRIELIKGRWEREVLRGLERLERRVARAAPERAPLAPVFRPHEREMPVPEPRPNETKRPSAPDHRPRQTPKRRSGLAVQVDRIGALTFAFLRFRRGRYLPLRHVWPLRPGAAVRRFDPLAHDAERVARRAAFRLFTHAMPAPIRTVIALTRELRGIGLRSR
jgi:hypothetical protein